MRRLLWLLIAAALSAVSAQADDGWQKAFTFPLSSNTGDAGRGTTFTDPADGFTYAYFGANTASGAQVWRSSDGVSWNQVNVNGFGSQGGQPLHSSVAWLSSYTVAGIPYVYVGVTPNNSLNDGIAIYRSTGGTSTSQWSLVLSSNTLGGFVASTPGGGPGTAFNGFFYFGAKNTVTGGDVWKSATADSIGSWSLVAANGFGEGASANPNVSYLKVFGGKLYAATNCLTSGAPCGQIWSNPGTDVWTQVLVATNAFDAQTHSISAMESFNGSLYVTTLNSSAHAQVLRSATPDTGPWQEVFTPDSGCSHCFSVAGSTEVHSLRALGGYLYASTWNSQAGLLVHRSADGANWTRSNSFGGFVSVNNQYLGDFALLGTTVLGDSFNSSGGALWSALLPGAAGPPSTPSAASVFQTSITWTWAAVAGATSYNVYQATRPSTLVASAAAPSVTEVGLSTNTLNGIIVKTVNAAGTSVPSPVGSAYTAAAPPTGLSLNPVWSSSMTVSWSANTNPVGTVYRVDYWLPSGSTISATTVTTSDTLTGLLDGATYSVTVSALNGSGTATGAGVVLSTLTINVPSLATVVASNGGTILFNTPSGVAELVIPPGAFGQTVTVTVSTTIPANFPVAPSPASQQLTPTGVGLQFNVSPPIEPSRTLTLVVPFTAAQMTGFNVNDLQLARYDLPENVWVPLSSSRSAANGQVVAAIDHFSMFQIMQAAAGGSVSSAKAFPNPLRPALGESYMTFSMLPASARVRVYTLTGVLVKDLTTDATGTANWDATNGAGNPVASGVYFVYAQAGGERRTLKVAVQR